MIIFYYFVLYTFIILYCTHERFPELVTCNLREFRNYFYLCIYESNVIFIELLIVTVYAIL